jgi:DNA (cytosine-5)-methyltransferase 1
MQREIIVDSFAGGGGASLGIAWALGRAPDIAINHNEQAIAMHEANHPSTVHVLEDVWKADLRKLVGNRKVGLVWGSPDCTHFSRAKGAVPVKKEIRSLAWVIVRWASQIKPRVIILENVREFADWGPVVPQWVCECGWKGTEGQAILKRTKRRCPRCESSRLKETLDLIPDPSKKGMTFRLFVNRLRGLGYEVQWRNLNAADFGAPTHRRRLFLIARCDGQPIVWPEATHGDPKNIGNQPLFEPLKPWRTAAECIDWNLPCPSIFERSRPLKEATLRRIAMGIKRFVLESEQPFVVRCNHGGEHFRGQPADVPFCTVTSSRDAHGLITPILSKYHGQKLDESRCKKLEEPFNTLDTQPRYALVAPVIERQFGKSAGASCDEPLPTTTAGGGGKSAVVSAFIAKHFGGMVGVAADTPLPTTMSKGWQNQLVEASLLPISEGVDHSAKVYAFLTKYFGTAIGQHIAEPLHTVTAKDRFGLVTVSVGGEPYVVVDIGMRMLTPRELARAQGFPETYLLTGSKTSQVARIGNSVCPHVAKALVESNFRRS